SAIRSSFTSTIKKIVAQDFGQSLVLLILVCFRGRLMSLSVCDLRVSSRPLFPQESTYFSSAGYTRRRMFNKVYAKTLGFTLIKTLLSQPLFILSTCQRL